MTRSRIIPALIAVFVMSGQIWAQEVFTAGDKGVTPPRVVKLVKPTYTPAATALRIEGTVKMKAVVLSDGKVGDVIIVQSLDGELDELAVTACRRQWAHRFDRPFAR
jgi:TonB family protein